jgi:site-specific recombinase XerD
MPCKAFIMANYKPHKLRHSVATHLLITTPTSR